jgi:hypothetical protein
MEKLFYTVEQADIALRRGDRETAKSRLLEALAMEPPPLEYEVIGKKLASI